MTENELKEVIEVRRTIGDPVTTDFIFTDELPVTGYFLEVAYTTGDGIYHFYNGLNWRQYQLKFSDGYIRGLIDALGRIRASIKLIDNLIARVDPTDYITSGNAGGQSTSFPSLQDILDYYNALRAKLLEEEAAELGMNSGLMLRTRKKYIGGVLEEEDE